VSPLRGEKPQNRPLSKRNTGRFALRAMLPVNKGETGNRTDGCRLRRSALQQIYKMRLERHHYRYRYIKFFWYDCTFQGDSCRRFGRPFAKWFALCHQNVACLSVCPVLSVTFVHCGQTIGRIKVKLGMQIGLGPGHIVLDGDQLPLPQRGTAISPNFRPISVAAKWLHGSRCHLVWS